jgi:HlyD family secretion protein
VARKRNKSLKWLIIIGSVFLLLVIWAVMKSRRSGTTVVKTEKAAMRTIVERISASGKIYPEVEVAIIPEISGEVTDVYVEDGDSVKEGDPLIRINPDIYKESVERARAAVLSAQASQENAKAMFTQASARLASARLEFNRSKNLLEQKVISQSEFEAAKTTFEIAEAEVESAKQNVNGAHYSVMSAQATYNEMQSNLGKTTVYAPMDGIVSLLNVEEGKVVGGIAQFAATEVMRIADFTNMEVRVEVSENDILHIGLGDTAEVEVEAYPDRKFSGIVTQVSASASTAAALITEQATNFTVIISLLHSSYMDLVDPAKGKVPFLPGMSATVDIISDRVTNVLSVPIESVTARADIFGDTADVDEDSLKEYVFLVKDSKAAAQVVTSGIQDDKYIHITSGLNQDAEVIAGPYDAIHEKLRDESKVRIDNEEKKSGK